jgi:hypothetical protein
MRGWLLLIAAVATLGVTSALGLAGAKAGRWPEWMHLAGHLGLCGGMAFATAWATTGSVRRKMGAGLAAGMALGLAIEWVQAGVYPTWREALYDLGVDAVACWGGVLLWGWRQPEVGHGASAGLHPLVVGPLGIVAVVGPSWTALLALCLAPAIAAWLTGLADGRLSDGDVSVREERGPLFLVGTTSGLAFLSLASLGDVQVQLLGWVLAVGAVLGTAVTAAGFKVSGHVGIPVALGLWAAALEERVAVPLLLVALMLSWARTCCGRHRPVEVGGAWVMGLVLTAGVMLVVG